MHAIAVAFCTNDLNSFAALQLYLNITKYIVQIMKCKLQMKTNKNERGIWGLEFGLTEMWSPPPPWIWDSSIN